MSSAIPTVTTPVQGGFIACNLAAIPTAERDEHIARAKQLLFTEIGERYELPNGTAWRLPIAQYADLARFIDNERRCCPFFTFELEVRPQREAIWLRITGSETVAAFLQNGLNVQDVSQASVVSMLITPSQEYPIACDLTALTNEEEVALTDLAKHLLFEISDERHELPDGYAWRFAPAHYDQVAQFIDLDSRCCAFWSHSLAVTPHSGPIWLRITGSDAAKIALRAELDRLQNELSQASPHA